jgi:TetR/AcrR family transcriptional regulator, regulator of cefoperazone and chloramphenicol sensitivity
MVNLLSSGTVNEVDSADLTAKARIRNAALELHATKGESNTTVREVAEAAGVTHGLVVHHFGNKEGLRRAVEEYLLTLLRRAVESPPLAGTPDQIARERDASVARMYAEHPAFLRYLRRTLLDPSGSDSELRAAIAEYTLSSIRELRAAGIATSSDSQEQQAFAIIVRELGPRLLEPFLEQIWTHLTDGEESNGAPPRIEVRVARRATATRRSAGRK